MWKRTWGITFAVLVLILAAAAAVWYVQKEAVPEGYEYMLRNYNGYVAVYELPADEIYEYTDVILEILPAKLQEEIQEGKYLKNEEELYNFLENYTS